MNFKHLLISTLLLLPVSYEAKAQMDNNIEMHKGKHGGKKGFMKKLKALNLSPEQLEKIKAIRKEKKANKEANRAHRQEMKNLKEKLVLALKGTQSQSDIRALNEKIKAAQAKKQDERFEMMLKIREILTPEQRENFDFAPERGRKGKRGRK